MTGPTRRDILLGAGMALAAAGLARPRLALAGTTGWIEVMGSAPMTGPADQPAARRRAVADALLAAALAGGADVRGHSVVSNTRLTSDLLIVRPTGQVLEHRILSESCDGQICRVSIRARVAPPAPKVCGVQRQLVLTLYPPVLRVSAAAPAWSDALARDLAQSVVQDAEADRSVARAIRADRLPADSSTRDATDYRTLISGSRRPEPGGHGLHIHIDIAPEGERLVLALRLRLEGPTREVIERRHQAEVRMPRPSVLGRAAPLAEADRRTLAAKLGGQVRPTLADLLNAAACEPVKADMLLADGKLTVPVGKRNGLRATSLAVTLDDAGPLEMLEIVRLQERSAQLSPLNPAIRLTSMQGRAIRFIDTSQALP